MEDKLILTIDVGSSSVRASLYDRIGRYVNDTEVQLPYSFTTTSGDGAELDADELVDLIARAVDGTLWLAQDKAERIVGVATSTFWHSVLGVDREGLPTTPIVTWADRRAGDAAAELRGRLDEAAVHRRTGCVLHSSYLPAKLLWLSRSSPEAFSRTERWMSPGEYLQGRLCGRTWVGTSMASATGLFDQNEMGRGGTRGVAHRRASTIPDLRRADTGFAGRVGYAVADAQGSAVVPGRR